MKFLILFCVLNSVIFSQEKYKKVLFVNEAFVAVNHTFSLTDFSRYDFSSSSIGKTAFDFGSKIIRRENKKVNFVYGLEFEFVRNYLTKAYRFGGQSSSSYKNVSISNFALSNSINARFNFGKSKRIFFETGLLINFLILRKVKGQTEFYSAFPDGTNIGFKDFHYKVQGPSAYLGLNFGFGYNLLFKDFEIGLKPEIRFNALPYLTRNNHDNFANFSYTRFVLILRKLNKSNKIQLE